MNEKLRNFEMVGNRTVSSKGDKIILLKTTDHKRNQFIVVLSCMADDTKFKPMIIFKRKTAKTFFFQFFCSSKCYRIDGWTRKILGLKKIPVRIIVRHQNWFKFIKHLQSVLPKQRSYQSLGHPDLDTNFTIDHPCYDRFEVFSEYLPKAAKESKSLDI